MFLRWRTPLAMALLATIIAGCTRAVARSAVGPDAHVGPNLGSAKKSSFITTIWCGPPYALFDDGRAAEIAAAGFTVAGPPCEGHVPFSVEAATRALDVAARHEIRLWIADPRYSERARDNPDWEAAVAAAVTDYSSHPGFGGYFVADEPTVKQYEDLAAIVARLRRLDPGHIAYINLLPDYAIRDAGASSYRDYVERFITTVNPSLLSYDYYPFGVGKDRPTFFTSLALLRELSQTHRMPFMLILLAMPHANYRDPSEAEVAWQAFHALAYGARGISYFAYWTPVNVELMDVMKFRHGLVEHGKPTRHHTDAARLNPRLRAIADELETLRSVLVVESREHATTSLATGPLAAIEGGPVTAGVFSDGAGRSAVLVVNRDYRFGTSVRLHRREGTPAPQRFDDTRRSWRDGTETRVRLDAGQAVLLR